jgi:hypothetical protein
VLTAGEHACRFIGAAPTPRQCDGLRGPRSVLELGAAPP